MVPIYVSGSINTVQYRSPAIVLGLNNLAQKYADRFDVASLLLTAYKVRERIYRQAQSFFQTDDFCIESSMFGVKIPGGMTFEFNHSDYSHGVGVC